MTKTLIDRYFGSENEVKKHQEFLNKTIDEVLTLYEGNNHVNVSFIQEKIDEALNDDKKELQNKILK